MLRFTSHRAVVRRGDVLVVVRADLKVTFLSSLCSRQITVASLQANNLLSTGSFPAQLRFRWS